MHAQSLSHASWLLAVLIIGPRTPLDRPSDKALTLRLHLDRGRSSGHGAYASDPPPVQWQNLHTLQDQITLTHKIEDHVNDGYQLFMHMHTHSV